MEKRRRVEGELVAFYDGGALEDHLSDGRDFCRRNVRARHNPQNDRRYYRKPDRGDSASGELQRL